MKQTSGKQIIIKILSEQCNFSQILATTVCWGKMEIILSENILFDFYKILSSFFRCQQDSPMSMIKLMSKIENSEFRKIAQHLFLRFIR